MVATPTKTHNEQQSGRQRRRTISEIPNAEESFVSHQCKLNWLSQEQTKIDDASGCWARTSSMRMAREESFQFNMLPISWNYAPFLLTSLFNMKKMKKTIEDGDVAFRSGSIKRFCLHLWIFIRRLSAASAALKCREKNHVTAIGNFIRRIRTKITFFFCVFNYFKLILNQSGNMRNVIEMFKCIIWLCCAALRISGHSIIYVLWRVRVCSFVCVNSGHDVRWCRPETSSFYHVSGPRMHTSPICLFTSTKN